MDKPINHNRYRDESKSRTHRFSKLPDDGDPWALNNLLTPEQEKCQLNPVDQATDKKLRAKPAKMNSFMSGPPKSLTPDPPAFMCHLTW